MFYLADFIFLRHTLYICEVYTFVHFTESTVQIIFNKCVQYDIGRLFMIILYPFETNLFKNWSDYTCEPKNNKIKSKKKFHYLR